MSDYEEYVRSLDQLLKELEEMRLLALGMNDLMTASRAIMDKAAVLRQKHQAS